MKRAIYILIISLIPVIVLGNDYNFKRKKVYPKLSDTTSVLIYETEFAEIYLSQDDILASIKTFEDSIIYKELIETLNSNSQFFHLVADSIYDKVYELDLGNNCIQKGEFPSGNDIRDRMNRFISFLVVDLIIDEKFSLKVKPSTSFYKGRVIIKKEDGIMGSEYISFYCMRNIKFLDVAWALGE